MGRRPICSACGGICIESVTAVEIRGPSAPPTAFVTCSDCATELVRRLSARSKGVRLEPIGSAETLRNEMT